MRKREEKLKIDFLSAPTSTYGEPLSLVYDEGTYFLFIKSSTSLNTTIYLFTSTDGIKYSVASRVARLSPLSRRVQGSAIFRNKKLCFLYGCRRKLMLATGKNKGDWKLFPVPVLKLHNLPKTENAIRLRSPRALFSSGKFYLFCVLDKVKDNCIAVLGSPNLINWEYEFTIQSATKKAEKFDYPSAQIINLHQFLFYTITTDDITKFYAQETALRLDKKSVTPITDRVEIRGIKTPRTSTLPDGRVVLIGTTLALDGNTFIVPRKLNFDNGLVMNPIEEILDYRKEILRGNRLNLISEYVFSGEPYKNYDLELECFSENSEILELHLLGKRTNFSFRFGFKDGVFSYSNSAKDSSLSENIVLGASDNILFRALIFGNRLEIFVNGGSLTLTLPFGGIEKATLLTNQISVCNLCFYELTERSE